MREREFVAAVQGAGGRVFLVGGAVRDMMLELQAGDRDYMVSGLTEETFTTLFPKAIRVGKSFPVYLQKIDGRKCEVAFARRERKTGRGYRGFVTFSDTTVTPEEDLVRRDLTMNSLALELPERKLLDPCGGAADIKRHLIRANSEHFAEDPVRALRAARFAARYEFTVTEGTLSLMRSQAEELQDEPSERIMHELTLALKCRRPSLFFRVLDAAGLLAAVFPEIARLKGKTQPIAYHPEGDAFEHTMQVVDKAAALTENVTARFAALAHDLGKGTTPTEMLPHHYDHERRGLTVIDEWNRRVTLPLNWRKAAKFVIREHMRAPRLKKNNKIVDLLQSIKNGVLPPRDFNACILADHGSLPVYLAEQGKFLAALLAVNGSDVPPNLSGAAIGAWVRAQQAAAVAKLKYELTKEDISQ